MIIILSLSIIILRRSRKVNPSGSLRRKDPRIGFLKLKGYKDHWRGEHLNG